MSVQLWSRVSKYNDLSHYRFPCWKNILDVLFDEYIHGKYNSIKHSSFMSLQYLTAIGAVFGLVFRIITVLQLISVISQYFSIPHPFKRFRLSSPWKTKRFQTKIGSEAVTSLGSSVEFEPSQTCINLNRMQRLLKVRPIKLSEMLLCQWQHLFCFSCLILVKWSLTCDDKPENLMRSHSHRAVGFEPASSSNWGCSPVCANHSSFILLDSIMVPSVVIRPAEG